MAVYAVHIVCALCWEIIWKVEVFHYVCVFDWNGYDWGLVFYLYKNIQCNSMPIPDCTIALFFGGVDWKFWILEIQYLSQRFYNAIL